MNGKFNISSMNIGERQLSAHNSRGLLESFFASFILLDAHWLVDDWDGLCKGLFSTITTVDGFAMLKGVLWASCKMGTTLSLRI